MAAEFFGEIGGLRGGDEVAQGGVIGAKDEAVVLYFDEEGNGVPQSQLGGEDVLLGLSEAGEEVVVGTRVAGRLKPKVVL